ncbi:hypothetical protein M407DRAFT_29645 [Tulasnella calospora MUT 4182]|uniref:Protein kinase domain-containing protein n=1 Tax=Tulasnella calospora MUT 4182 TaxID=1051891 RepID=A0A0C3LGX6_9AGAM|nr:hypothetical protein M407DRAFT_29645 [Tulasnella calospora MUT 4182]
MNPPICHGDLKSLNILVNSENRAVITDFGSARAVDSVVEREFKDSRATNATQTPHSPAMEAQEAEVLTAEIALSRDFITITGPAWTVRWAAPELLDGYLPSLASDIWALGWICWEAVTGNFPFDQENDVAAVLRITKGELPIVENDDQFHQIKALCSLMRECWKLDTNERPTAVKCQQIVSWMDQIVPYRREPGSLSVTRSSGLLYALGRIRMRNSMYTEAQEYFEQSLKVAESVGDEGGEARVVKAIGDVYHLRDEYSRAEESYIQARHIYSQIGDRLGFAQSVKNLGDVYRMRNEYSKLKNRTLKPATSSLKSGISPALPNRPFQDVDRQTSKRIRLRSDHSAPLIPQPPPTPSSGLPSDPQPLPSSSPANLGHWPDNPTPANSTDTEMVQVESGNPSLTSVKGIHPAGPPRAPRPIDDNLPPNLANSTQRFDQHPEENSSPSDTTARPATDSFGIYRSYRQPIATTRSTGSEPDKARPETRSTRSFFWPYPNISSFLLGNWFWRGSGKSRADRDALVKDVLLHPKFVIDDIRGVNFNSIDDTLALLNYTTEHDPTLPDGWSKTPLQVSVPIAKSKPQNFTVSALHHRNIMAVIRDTFGHHPAARRFCYQPYREYQGNPHKPTSQDKHERLFGELYTSDAFNSEHEKIQQLPSNDSYPKAIAALMFWSDSTHLAQFGQAKLWPLYLYFGNQSKYERGRPTSQSAHHIAYFPSLPDSIKDFVSAQSSTSTGLRPAVLAHCRRELMHEAWKKLLDPEFLSAYEHGTVVKCADGVTRRLFPRIFTYSADYPEKVLLATIRDFGRCPCPRCLILKEQIAALGTQSDKEARIQSQRKDTESRREKVQKARSSIAIGQGVSGTAVENLLAEESLVPTENAFSTGLHAMGVNFFSFFVPDLLHEFDLGVWKSFFTHLIRLLNSVGSWAVGELDKRYRQVDPFGRQTIRKFDANVSEMKKLAARDFEDLLLVSMPAFDGLFSAETNAVVQDCLFTLCYWHALAKLRIHTESTLQLLEKATTDLGFQLRRFVAEGELEHRRVKGYWKRTNFRDATSQIAAADRRVRFHERIIAKLKGSSSEETYSDETVKVNPTWADCPPDIHHRIAERGTPLNLPSWLNSLAHDPATKLLDHILARLAGGHYEGKDTRFSEADRNSIMIRNNRLFNHSFLRVNYTTYDLRREQDIINLTNKRDILLLADEDEQDGVIPHPFWYARVLGILHAEVKDRRVRNSQWQRMDFLWVRWFGRDMEYNAGWKAKRLDRIGYVPDEEGAFGFVDPAWVVRSVHLIPAFSEGVTEKYIPKASIASDSESLGDWEFYHVNRFCDRDMFMRFTGLGPGHVHLFADNPFGIDVQANMEHFENENQDVLSSLGVPDDDSSAEDTVASSDDEPESEDEVLYESEDELVITWT